MTHYQKLRTINMPLLQARERLLQQLALKFEIETNARARELAQRGIDWGDIWHANAIPDAEMKKLVSGYLKYHAAHRSLEVNLSALTHEVYKLTGELHTSKSVAELEAQLRARRSA